MAAVTEADWSCPICCDLAFRPAVNACGHVFCFWCLHKAMSPYAPSHCPLCRSTFTYFPAACGKLHALLRRHFPAAYEERARETQEEEEKLGLTPAPLEPLPEAPPSEFSEGELLCDDPACGKLLLRPVVLNCGHVVCQAPCMRVSPDGAASNCPACGHTVQVVPSLCKQLDDLLQRCFPAQQAQRAAEAAAAAPPPPPAAAGAVPAGDAAAAAVAAPSSAAVEASSSSEPSAEAGGADEASEEQEEDPTTPRGTPQEGGGPGPGSAAAVSPSLLSAIRRRRGEGATASALAQRLEDNLRRLTGDSYVHHGVGCDVCGMYPIQGRRYQCKDCPEAIGFDLCGVCQDRGASAVVGRFNQQHTAGHRMELIRPRITAMHLLQAANPELPIEQLMWLLELAFGGEGGEEGGGAGPAQEQQQQAEAQGQPQGREGEGAQGQAAGEEERPIPMPRGRGPRPAPDPTAEEPSPSAIPAPPGGAGASGGGGAPGEAPGELGDVSLVFVPLEALLGAGADELENNVEVEEDAPQQQQQGGVQQQGGD